MDPYQYPASGSRNEYLIHIESFDSIPTVSREEGQRAVLHSAAIWNSHANGGHFKYVGTTNFDGNIPTWVANPASCPVSNSVVRVVTGCEPGLLAQAVPRCAFGISPTMPPTIWEIRICADNPWFVGAINPQGYDLVTVMAHEMGHTLDLAHPHKDAVSVMQRSLGFGEVHREIFDWDIRCATENSNERISFAQRFDQFGAAPFWSGNFIVNILKFSPLLIRDDGVDLWHEIFLRRNPAGPPYWMGIRDTLALIEKIWTNNLPGLFQGDYIGISPTSAIILEDDDLRPKLLSVNGAGNGGVWTKPHAVYQAILKSWVPSITLHSPLRHCEKVSGNSCDNPEQIPSASRVQLSYDQYSSTTVTGVRWHEPTNLGGGPLQHQIFVAHGFYNASKTNPMYPLSTSLGPIRSTVGPGIACGTPFQADGADCLAAYVDPDDSSFNIRIVRFYADNNCQPTSQWCPTVHDIIDLSPLASVTDLTVWFHSNRFWMGLKVTNVNENIEVWSSIDGAEWQFEENLGPAITGASSQAFYSDGLNHVFTLID